MPEKFYSLRSKRSQDPAARRSELASLKKMRPLLFWAVVASTITPMGYMISLALIKHTGVFAPLMAWFVAAMNLITYLRLNQRIQTLKLLEQIPPANAAYDFTM